MIRTPVPPIVLLGRITAIVGMSLSMALAILMLMAAELLLAGIGFAAFFPFFGLLHWIERLVPESKRPA